MESYVNLDTVQSIRGTPPASTQLTFNDGRVMHVREEAGKLMSLAPARTRN